MNVKKFLHEVLEKADREYRNPDLYEQMEGPQGQNIIPVHLKTANPYIYDANGAQYKVLNMTDQVRRAKANGHDSIIFKNVNDSPNPKRRQLSTITAVFDPSQIRSKFAGFNPKKAKSGNITAGIGAATAAGAAASKDNE